MAHQIDWFPKIVKITFTGHVTGTEVLGAISEFYSNPQSDEIVLQIIDYLEVSRLDISDFDLKQIAAQGIGSAQYLPHQTIVYVTNSQAITETIKRWWDILSHAKSNWKYAIVDSLAQLPTLTQLGAPSAPKPRRRSGFPLIDEKLFE